MIKILIAISVFFLCQTSVNAQILKKLKGKAENAAGKVIEKKRMRKSILRVRLTTVLQAKIVSVILKGLV